MQRNAPKPDTIPGRVFAQCGYHKCLTMYARRTYRRACRLDTKFPRGIRHFGHNLSRFYAECKTCRIASVSGHALDLDRFEDIRVVRLIRDPRDLLVSAYHYHKRDAEAWCHVVNPAPNGWDEVRGHVPKDFPSDASMMSYLNKVPFEDGLRMEYAFRRNHLTSMREWPLEDDRILLIRYEDLIGNEEETFARVLDFMGFSGPGLWWGLSYAKRHAAGKSQARRDHIRDAKSGQWRGVVPEDVVEAMGDEFGDVLERYGYPLR